MQKILVQQPTSNQERRDKEAWGMAMETRAKKKRKEAREKRERNELTKRLFCLRRKITKQLCPPPLKFNLRFP